MLKEKQYKLKPQHVYICPIILNSICQSLRKKKKKPTGLPLNMSTCIANSFHIELPLDILGI